MAPRRKSTRSTHGKPPQRYSAPSESDDSEPTLAKPSTKENDPDSESEPDLDAGTKPNTTNTKAKVGQNAGAKTPSTTGRGRQNQQVTDEDEADETPAIKRRGRQKKAQTEDDNEYQPSSKKLVKKPAGQGRGGLKKTGTQDDEGDEEEQLPSENPASQGRGRSRKSTADEDEGKSKPTPGKATKAPVSGLQEVDETDGDEQDKGEDKTTPAGTGRSRGRPKTTAAAEDDERDPTPADKPPKREASSSSPRRRKKPATEEVEGMLNSDRKVAVPAKAPSTADGASEEPSTAPEEDKEYVPARSSTDLDAPTPVDTSAEMPSSTGDRNLSSQSEEQEAQEPKSTGMATASGTPDNSTPPSDARGSQKRQRGAEEEEGIESSRKKRAKTPQQGQEPESSKESPTESKLPSNTSESQKGQKRPAEEEDARGAIVNGGAQKRQAIQEDAESRAGDEVAADPATSSSGVPLARRSQRVRKAVLPFRVGSESGSNASRSRRKRKASLDDPDEDKEQAAEQEFDFPEDLLEAVLAPWEDGELAECPGWTELESEPLLLREIMKSWGITGATVKELHFFDEDTLKKLPRPVYGLVFLSRYTGGSPKEVGNPGDLPWFANQVTKNACGTFALLNILLNAEGLSLGEKLEQIKQETKDLSAPQRGYVIANNAWLRSTHNVFTRRIDLMNESLVTFAEVNSEPLRKQRNPNKKIKPTGGAQGANHFVGFVPIGNSVWHMDGLREEGPVHAGTFNDGQDWYIVVEPWLTDQIVNAAADNKDFNLIAICAPEDPVETLRAELATNIRCLHDLQIRWHKPGKAIYAQLCEEALKDVATKNMIFWDIADDLGEFGLNREEIDKLAHPDAVANVKKTETPEAAAKMCKDLCITQISLKEDYRKAMEGQVAEEKASGRKEDFTPFIHEFLKQMDMHYPTLETLYKEAEEEDELRKKK